MTGTIEEDNSEWRKITSLNQVNGIWRGTITLNLDMAKLMDLISASKFLDDLEESGGDYDIDRAAYETVTASFDAIPAAITAVESPDRDIIGGPGTGDSGDLNTGGVFASLKIHITAKPTLIIDAASETLTINGTIDGTISGGTVNNMWPLIRLDFLTLDIQEKLDKEFGEDKVTLDFSEKTPVIRIDLNKVSVEEISEDYFEMLQISRNGTKIRVSEEFNPKIPPEFSLETDLINELLKNLEFTRH
jgi:hypothetical protein